MSEIDRAKEWTLPDGRRLGYRQHVEPWFGGIAWATVNLDTNEVLAVERYDPYLEVWTAGATCPTHMLNPPPGVLKAQFVSDAVEAICQGIQPLRPPTAEQRYIKALERAIEAEGYLIMVSLEPETVTLERRDHAHPAADRAPPFYCVCDNCVTQRETETDANEDLPE